MTPGEQPESTRDPQASESAFHEATMDLDPQASESAFHEATMDLDQVTLRPGACRLRLDLKVPPNYRINPLAPFEMTAQGDGGSVSVVGDPFRLRTGAPSFPVTVPLSLRAGSGSLFLRVMVYYCELPEEKLCFYQSRSVRIPIAVDAERGAPEATVTFQMELPTAPI